MYSTTYVIASSESLSVGALYFFDLALVYFGDTTPGWLAVYLLWTGVHNSRARLHSGRPNFVRWRLIFANPIWDLLHVTRLESRILRWLLRYRKICALLAVGVALASTVNLVDGTF